MHSFLRLRRYPTPWGMSTALKRIVVVGPGVLYRSRTAQSARIGNSVTAGKVSKALDGPPQHTTNPSEAFSYAPWLGRALGPSWSLSKASGSSVQPLSLRVGHHRLAFSAMEHRATTSS